MKRILLAAFFLLSGLLPAFAAADFQLMSKEELKSLLGSKKLTIIDTRSPAQCADSGLKLPGAVWLSAERLADWAKNVEKDRTLVVYCA